MPTCPTYVQCTLYVSEAGLGLYVLELHLELNSLNPKMGSKGLKKGSLGPGLRILSSGLGRLTEAQNFKFFRLIKVSLRFASLSGLICRSMTEGVRGSKRLTKNYIAHMDSN